MTTLPQPLAPSSSFTLKYDAWNRLVEVKEGTVVQANEYDGLNRRIIRDETGGSGVLTHFYYNQQWQVLEERVGTSSTADKQYVYHPHYVDAIALRYDANGDEHYYLQDANFNVTAVVDDTGTVEERYAYTPYGEVTVLDDDFAADFDGKSDISNEHLYTGRRLDPETGLQLNRNRFYAAGLGRWVNRDPIGYDGSQWNLYEYVNGMPTVGLDPQGEFIVVGGIIAAWLIWQAACAKYATSAAEDAFTNDKEKHCMAACLHNKCTGFFQPGATLGGAIGWEWLGGWSEGNNDSEQDIGAGAAGIVHSYFGDCKDSCEGCDAQFPVSPRPPNQGGGGGFGGPGFIGGAPS